MKHSLSTPSDLVLLIPNSESEIRTVTLRSHKLGRRASLEGRSICDESGAIPMRHRNGSTGPRDGDLDPDLAQ